MIKFRCSSCSQKLGVPDKYAGRKVRCNKCNEPALVPRAIVDVKSASPKPKPAPAKASPIQLENNPNAPVAPQPPTADIFDGFDIQADDDDAQRLEAIQIARQDRVARKVRSVKVSGKSPKEKKAKKNKGARKEGFSMMAFADMVPPVIAFPLSFVASLVAIGLTIGIWIMLARATDSGLNFFSLFIPVAGAFGLRLFMVNRTVLLGLLGLFIGVVGIGAAKIAISQYVIKDYYQRTSKEEILVNLDKILANDKGPTKSIKPYAIDGTYQLCTAMIYLIDQGEADPIKTRRWMVRMLNSANKVSIMDRLMDNIPERIELPDLEESEQQEKNELVSKASGLVFQWDEEKALLRTTKKYYPVLQKVITQSDHQRILADPDKSFKFCLIQSFGLFDAIWILVGLGMSYIMITFD